MRIVDEWRLLAVAAVLVSGVGLAACSSEGGADEDQAQTEQSAEPAPAEQQQTEQAADVAEPAEESTAMENTAGEATADDAEAAPAESREDTPATDKMAMDTVPGSTPADAVRALLVPGYVFPPDGGGTLEAPTSGDVADYAPILDADGEQQGYVALLVEDGQVVAYDDPSSVPGDGFVFIPYYANSGGTGSMLTLGYFQLADQGLVQHSAIVVDDRAQWKGLDYLGEGAFVINALTHGPDQAMADTPDTPLTIVIERQGDAVVVSEQDVGTVVPAMGVDETGLVEITTNGLGPITAQSAYANVDLSGFLPGYDLTRTDQAMSEAGETSLLTFEGSGGTIRAEYVLDGPLFAISSSDPAVGSALGIAPGDGMVEYWDSLSCAPGLEVFSAGMICTEDGTPHLAVYFSGPRPDNVPDGWVPARHDPLAEEWTAEQVLWLENVYMAQHQS